MPTDQTPTRHPRSTFCHFWAAAGSSRSRALLASVLSLALLAGGGAQTTTYSPVVGFVKLTLAGTSHGSGENYVAPGLLEEEAFRGVTVAGAPAANSLQAVSAAWTTNQFVTNASAHSHFVEIVASSNANAVGLYTDIVSHTADTLTTVDNFASQLVGGETIVIRAHKTVAKLFGAADESELGQGASTTSDTVSVMSPGVNPSFNSFYYRSGGGFGGTGWRTTTNPLADQAATPVPLGQGLLVQRRQATDLSVVIEGYVHQGPLRIPLKTGYNLIDPLAPITNQSATAGPAFTIGGTPSSTTIPSGLGNTFNTGSTATADVLNIASAGSLVSYYQRAAGSFGGPGWRTTTNPLANAETTIIPANVSLLIQLRSGDTKWNRPQPFTIP